MSFSIFLLTGPVYAWKNNTSLARAYAGKNPSPAQIQQTEELLGLDKPWYIQYGTMIRRVVLGPSEEEKARLCPGATDEECKRLIGHLGRSFQKTRSVDSIIFDRLPATVSLSVVAAIMWLTMGVLVGILSAVRPRSLFDRGATAFVLIGQSLPVYYFGLLGLYFLAFRFKIFPLGGYVPITDGVWPWFSHLLLPGITLAFQFAAIYVRMTRASVISALNEDYVRTARAKGASEGRVLVRHALRNAMLPIVTIFGLDLGTLLGGAILTEYTFGISGLGRLTVESARSIDIPLMTGVVLFAGAAIVIANIVVDLLYAVIDPRIRLT